MPTIAEQGYPNYNLDGWLAVVGPGKLPAVETARVNAAFKAALDTPEVRAMMTAQGYTINGGTPEAAQQFFRAELAKHSRLVKQAGVKID